MPNAQLMPRPPLIKPEDVAIFKKAAAQAVRAMGLFHESLTPRERVVLSIGLHASHAEEAMAAGDVLRYTAHMKDILDLTDTFSKMEPC